MPNSPMAFRISTLIFSDCSAWRYVPCYYTWNCVRIRWTQILLSPLLRLDRHD